MEYPTLITTGAAWYAPLVGLRTVSAVTAHELAHQWFYGIIASNEYTWPFLDEGLATYAESQLMDTFGSGSLFRAFGVALDTRALHRTMSAAYSRSAPIAQPARAFGTMKALAGLAYARTSTLLSTLGTVYGEVPLQRALSRYALDQRGRHAQPQDLLNALREHLGPEAAHNATLALFHRGWVDYSVDSIVSMALPPSMRQGEVRVLSHIIVQRRGSLQFPVDLTLTTADGERRILHWDGRGNGTTFEHLGRSAVVAAVVDPHHRVLLDQNLLNNARTTRQPRPWSLLERVTFAGELLLLGLAP
jgi:hypothetical protein